jgi:RNA polymerase sigma factor (sigma-70 family)
MAEDGRALLLWLFKSHYQTLKGRLARRLGSADAADEALQETYLRMERMSLTGAVRHPYSYFFRVALNVAADLRRSEQRRLGRSEVELLLQLERDELDPERVTEARSSVRALVQALDMLTPRQRGILVAARLEGLTHGAVAARFGISTRLVERELKIALDHCRDHLELNHLATFGTGRPAPSKE